MLPACGQPAVHNIKNADDMPQLTVLLQAASLLMAYTLAMLAFCSLLPVILQWSGVAACTQQSKLRLQNSMTLITMCLCRRLRC